MFSRFAILDAIWGTWLAWRQVREEPAVLLPTPKIE